MKGVVFTEFLEMVERRFGLDVADQVIASAAGASAGAYTAVGTYDFAELARMVSALSGLVGVGVPDLLRAFGREMFPALYRSYPGLVERYQTVRDFLMDIDGYIHAEVLKLYPDAELPSFSCTAIERGGLEMVYRSTRPLADFAEGLIAGCAEHFGEEVQLKREQVAAAEGVAVLFRLRFAPRAGA